MFTHKIYYGLVISLTLLTVFGCSNTTQLDKYNKIKNETDLACNFQVDKVTMKSCNTDKPVKPKTRKYLYKNKEDYIKKCKTEIQNDVMSKANGLEAAVAYGSMTNQAAIYTIKIITNRAKKEMKNCEQNASNYLHILSPEWDIYKNRLNEYNSNIQICNQSKKNIEIYKKQCTALKSELMHTQRGSYTWDYLTKNDNVLLKVILSPIALPIALIKDALN